MKKEMYYECSLFEKYGYVLDINNTEIESVFEYFSFPEFSIERQQLEFRTLDYTHKLTNICNHVLTHGYTYCPNEHFQHLATNRPDILSRTVIFDKIDIQNAFIAMHMFSKQVEDYFQEQGWIESAEFICIVRQWHSACNMWGIGADE